MFTAHCSLRVRGPQSAGHGLAWSYLLLLVITFLAACALRPRPVTIVADGERRTLHTEAQTVRQLLQEADITLGDLDVVQPDLWEEIRPGMVITVTRIEEHLEVERAVLPFPRRILKDESLGPGESRIVQAGANGEEEIVYRVIYKDGVESERQVLRRTIIQEPVEEIVVVGVQEALPAVPITGTIAYISNGNAWVMRHRSRERRQLTTAGDLDRRVFSLSPDGRYLLFTRRGGEAPEEPLNTLWLVDTTVLRELPRPLGITNVIYAEWSPSLGSGAAPQYRFAYATATRTARAPYWKAHNDLWLATADLGQPASLTPTLPLSTTLSPLTVTVRATQVLTPSEVGVYSWWGTEYAWSPDGRHMAYARPDQVGLVDLKTGKLTPLMRFPPYHTYEQWVWVPSLSWSPDGRFIVCVLHSPPPGEGNPEESPIFDLWVLEVDGEVQARLVPEVGMWAAPRWSPVTEAGDEFIAYGVAQSPRQSDLSRYFLYTMDRDGSNKRRLFPPPGEVGLKVVEIAWSPDGLQVVVAYNGNLYLVDVGSGQARQLTADGQSERPRWSR